MTYPVCENRGSEHAHYINQMSKHASECAELMKTRFAACLVHRGEIKEIGINRKKSHPFQARFGKNPKAIFLHAEVESLHRTIRYWGLKTVRESTLYVVRVRWETQARKTLVFGLAEPCSGCKTAIAEFEIPRVVFTLDGPPNAFEVWEK